MSKNKKETICAIVVTHNRRNLLIECLESLRKQTKPLDGIYIIDNASTDGTKELLKEKNYIKEFPPENIIEPWEKRFNITNLTDGAYIDIHYVHMHENTGGAGGFHEGVKRAYKNGYKWLWLMDDDVTAITNAIEMLMKYTDYAKCIQPSRKYSNGVKFYWGGKYFDDTTGLNVEKIAKYDTCDKKNINYEQINTGCFEGMFIHRSVINKIGFPDKRFFINGDDAVYGYLASKYSMVIAISDVCLIRKINKNKLKKKFFLFEVTNLSPFYLYYNFRNQFLKMEYINKYGKISWKAYYIILVRFLRSFFTCLIKAIIFRNIKIFTVLFKSYYDGITKKWGKGEF